MNLTSGSALAAIAGGLILGTATFTKLAVSGRILGISGAIKGALVGGDKAPWRAVFVSGLLAAGAVAAVWAPGVFQSLPPSYTVARAALGGLLVGAGAGLGNGCTSGHGICGNARLSVRSFVYTLTFMAAGAATATLTGSAAALGVAPVPPAATPFPQLAASALLPAASALALAGLPALLLAARALPPKAVDLAAEAWAGLTFGLGLAISGMVQPAKVAAFLTPLQPLWDPSLLAVMASALLVTTPAFRVILSGGLLKRPTACSTFGLPASTAVDAKLLLGGVLFGGGWGLSGMCPGPALVAAVALPGPQVLCYLVAMALGLWGQQYLPVNPASQS